MNHIYVCLPYHDILHVLSDCSGVTNDLYKLFGSYITTTIGELNSCSTIHKVVINKRESVYEFEVDGERGETLYPLILINNLLLHSFVQDGDVLALHGAAIEFDKKAFAFLAPSGKGKTTLVSYLIANGFGYVTDDCLLIDSKKLIVYPCTTPIHLRKSGFDVLNEYGAVPNEFVLLEGLNEKRFVFTPNCCFKNPLEIRCVFFSEYNNTFNDCVELPSVERVQELLISPMKSYKISPSYLESIISISKVKMFKLRYSDLYYVRRLLEQWRVDS